MNNILYIDLNSCFATIEQQSRPMLRGRPVAITNRITPNACIIAASYEAKAQGVKVGMRRKEAEAICKDIIFAETEPSKYIFVHEKLKHIMQDYSADVVMKSIDEGVINLAAAPPHIKIRNRVEIGHEIKQRLFTEIGDYMRCNVGIASNRFLAKVAAELHKPDGLDEITPENQRTIFATLKLTDLPGINTRMERRLNAVSIFTPLDFLDTDELTLVKLVCKSIDGTKWYKRLRGIEVDDYSSDMLVAFTFGLMATTIFTITNPSSSNALLLLIKIFAVMLVDFSLNFLAPYALLASLSTSSNSTPTRK